MNVIFKEKKKLFAALQIVSCMFIPHQYSISIAIWEQNIHTEDVLICDSDNG